jgi:membrane associated rhomboid family serine protease
VEGFFKILQFVLLLWGIYFFQLFTGVDLTVFGIVPRTEFGLIGIITAPLLHGGFVHLLSNTIPLLILGTTLYLFYPRAAARVFYMSYILTDILVWMVARPSIHIGSSGIVYGLAFYLLFIGVFRKDFVSVSISILTAFMYGGIVFGILPGQPFVSWETHLMGAIVGVMCAYYFRRPKKVVSR